MLSHWWTVFFLAHFFTVFPLNTVDPVAQLFINAASHSVRARKKILQESNENDILP